MFALLVNTGLRRGEVLALHWRDVDVEAGVLRVRGTLSRVDGRGVLEDLRDNGAIAVVFSQPSTARTVQLKGTGVAIATASAGDLAAVASCREALAADLASTGFSREFALRLLDAPDEDIVAVRFLPRSAFDQTPGPRAGAPLAGDQGARR